MKTEFTSISCGELTQFLNQTLEVTRFKDYCPNGLQVQGRTTIHTIVTGVSASLLLLEKAAELDADAILVHHGYFWRNEAPCIVGMKQKRLKFLLNKDINLLAYHLPLDAHPTLGNNAQLAQRLRLLPEMQVGENNLVSIGYFLDQSTITLEELGRIIESTLGRKPLLIGDPCRLVKKIAWCTGAAQGYMQEAIDAGADVYISGEISEPTTHLARESGVAYVAAGHHATERYGVAALGEFLAHKFGICHHFVDVDNPV